MNKAERLFQLVTLLRSRRTAMTAEVIARMMGISVRTVYRDVQALSLSGIPIEGEPGVGYLKKQIVVLFQGRLPVPCPNQASFNNMIPSVIFFSVNRLNPIRMKFASQCSTLCQ